MMQILMCNELMEQKLTHLIGRESLTLPFNFFIYLEMNFCTELYHLLKHQIAIAPKLSVRIFYDNGKVTGAEQWVPWRTTDALALEKYNSRVESEWIRCLWFCFMTRQLYEDLAAGLVAYYPLNGNAIDASNNGYDGSASAIAGTVSDRFGTSAQAFSFNGVTSKVQVSTVSPFDFTGDFSVSFWMNPATQVARLLKTWSLKLIGASGWLIRT
jgi:hypothetical protein